MMDKKEVFNHYSEILDELISNFNFFKTYFQDPFFIDEEVNVEDYPSYDFPCDLKIATGASRCCVVDRDYPYVVKMNLSETENRSDACEDEVSFYQAAKHWNCAQYLTEVEYLGIYTKEIYFYDVADINYNMSYNAYFDEEKFNNELQEMIDEDNSIKRKKITIRIPLYGYAQAEYYPIHSVPKVAVNFASPLCEKNENVGRAFLRDWGEDNFELFSEFLEEHRINDLHAGNVGCVNGKIVLIDFGGYHNGDSDY